MEVVQQIGSDSFTAGHGVLIGKTKTNSSTLRLVQLLVWYIDANPQDINQVDYVQADGTRRQGDARRRAPANDGTFHAGSNSGGEYEFKAAGNNLHFYILNKRADAQGVLHYTIGIRSLAGAGPQTRGVQTRSAAARASPRASRPARSR